MKFINRTQQPTPLNWRDRAALKRIEAARVLGISPATLDRRVRDGSIAAVKLGVVVLVPSREIAKLLGECAPEVTA